MSQLDPLLEDKVEIFDYGKGEHQIQLEVPRESSLTQTDIERILSIASWEGGRIDDKIDGYEGGRSVVITKDRPIYKKGIELKGLQISGVGYNAPEKVKGTYVEGESMIPPSTANFLDTVEENLMQTTVISGRTLASERSTYSPLGSYTEGRIRKKIENTRKALTFSVSFSRPTVEAYGRFVNLVHDNQHLGFIVFTIPSTDLRRFAAQYVKEVTNNRVPLHCFIEDIKEVMRTLGRNLRELHEAGYVHRQPHFSNFYYLINERMETIHLMDWSTMIPLGALKREKALNRIIDLRIVHQNVEKLCSMLYNAPKDLSTGISVDMLQQLLSSYFGRRIDVMSHYVALSEKRRREGKEPDVEDVDAIIELVRRELRKKR